MKKILFGLVALAFGALTSCTNDDIEISTLNPKHDVTLNISTQSMYDEFEITEDIRETALRENSYKIGVFSYVYDANGKLVDSKIDYMNTLNSVAQKFPDITEGKYTVLTIESLVEPNNKMEYFGIEDVEELSTIKITQKYSDPNYFYVIGVNSAEINVTGDLAINIVPKAIGSIIYYFPFNFENSSLTAIGFATNDILDYYSLNPSLDRQSRFHEDLTESGKTNIRELVSPDNSTGFVWGFYVLESQISWYLAAQNASSEKNRYMVWEPKNKSLEDGKMYFAGFYYIKEEVDNKIYYVASDLFDKIEDLVSWKQDWDEQIELDRIETLFVSPCTNWGGTVSEVKSYMSSMDLYQDIQKNDDGTYGMVYLDSNNNYTKYEYTFSSDTCGLVNAFIRFDSNKFNSGDIQNKLILDGFSLKDSEDGVELYQDATSNVGLAQNTSEIYGGYYEKSVLDIPDISVKKFIGATGFPAPTSSANNQPIIDLNVHKVLAPSQSFGMLSPIMIGCVGSKGYSLGGELLNQPKQSSIK